VDLDSPLLGFLGAPFSRSDSTLEQHVPNPEGDESKEDGFVWVRLSLELSDLVLKPPLYCSAREFELILF